MDFSGWYWIPFLVVVVAGNLFGATVVIAAIARLFGRDVTRRFILRVYAVLVGMASVLILAWVLWLWATNN